MPLSEATHILHHIRIKLYPNHMPGRIKGAYIARTASESTLSIEDVCAMAKRRGGFTGNPQEMAAHVRRYFDEAAYNLCDGFAIDNGYYSTSIHANTVKSRIE